MQGIVTVIQDPGSANHPGEVTHPLVFVAGYSRPVYGPQK